MYECPNCGGNLKFDIASQQLKCDYCLSLKDPYSVVKEKDAEENTLFDVTVFTCPQCAGEIFGTDNSAAEFCSFCGASTILQSRISKEKRPAHIIPFKQTKEACKAAYISKMKHAIFAPDELKDEKYIDSFRGIYMPYWSYHISHQGIVYLKGSKSYRRGDYVYKEKYDLSGHIDAYYNNLSYDASSSFSDDISGQIEPFHVNELQEFTPSFLSGFYADTADVDSSLYKEEALKIANTNSMNRIKSDSGFRDINIHADTDTMALCRTLCTKWNQPSRVMYPVWFMSYQKDGRVAYATVNGQTGKVAADIPVDIKKYTIGSLLLSIPIFILLNISFTILPASVLKYAGFLAIVTLVVYLKEITAIYHKDKRNDDKGYLFFQEKNASSGSERRKKETNGISFKELLAYSAWDNRHKIPGFAGSLIALLMTALILCWNPVEDMWYYLGAIISFFGTLLTITAVIRKYNILATRKLPQFDRSGGDDNA